MDLAYLATVNAVLNALGAICLIAGYAFIRKGRIEAHRRAMILAFVFGGLFLISYLTYHFQVGSVGFQGQGTIRTVYFSVLLSHTVLAATVPFLAVITLRRALKERFTQHKAIARWTLPIWLYVSITGVVVYLMLYRL
jgi:putative membrane protein